MILVPALAAEPPPFAVEPTSLEWTSAGVAIGALAVAGAFATLRFALRAANVQRVLSQCRSDEERRSLAPRLEHADRLATSASILSIAFRLFFVVWLFGLFVSQLETTWWALLGALVLAVPCVWLATEGIPLALARRYGDRILLSWAGPFHLAQLPISFLTHALEAVRRSFLRLLGLEDDSIERRIVEGLREVVAESEIDEDLDETEREIIGNVLEIGDVDVAAVMTPRTEIVAIEADTGLVEAARVVDDCGHSRIPVYEGNLDTIIGTFSARYLVKLLATGELEQSRLRDLLRPAFFVPETKEVGELMTEMRRERQKMAIVLDEYGGTAGLVTLTDILEEIVGELHDEFDADEPAPFRRLSDGRIEVDASMHVTDVNEELGLNLPEAEDFETLAGFVLSELGHFPEVGETFRREGHEYSITEANDRRVLKVCVAPLARERTA